MTVSILCAAALALPLSGFRTVIVGGGSGLLLRLLDAGGTVSLVEGRPDPRTEEYAKEGRAYALGLGLRGRTAIRTVDEPLWAAVRDAGFESDRFTLQIGQAQDRPAHARRFQQRAERAHLPVGAVRRAAGGARARHGVGGRLSTTFEARVTECDAVRSSVAVDAAGGAMSLSADCIAGCDGVNSVVRAGMERAAPAFSAELQPLPGNLKVVRLDAVPPPLAPDAVSVVPGSPVSAFIEPTKGGACALISWRDGGSGVDPAEVSDPDEAANLAGLLAVAHRRKLQHDCDRHAICRPTARARGDGQVQFVSCRQGRPPRRRRPLHRRRKRPGLQLGARRRGGARHPARARGGGGRRRHRGRHRVGAPRVLVAARARGPGAPRALDWPEQARYAKRSARSRPPSAPCSTASVSASRRCRPSSRRRSRRSSSCERSATNCTASRGPIHASLRRRSPRWSGRSAVGFYLCHSSTWLLTCQEWKRERDSPCTSTSSRS